MQKDLEKDLSRRIRDKSNIDLALKKLEEVLQEQVTKEDRLELVINEFIEILLFMFESVKITHAMMRQDEEDKKSITLTGAK